MQLLFSKFFKRKLYHLAHCAVFGLTLFLSFYFGGGLRSIIPVPDEPILDPVEKYGWIATVLLYLIQMAILPNLPLAIFNFLGFTMFDAFLEEPKIKWSTVPVPFICFRVVTRGDYPELVRQTVQKNLKICHSAGLEHFVIEVVTDKSINLIPGPKTREIVVPEEYRTRSGAKFKARALQYCIEDEVNELKHNDWIVHMDEETLLTESSVKGIINFVRDGKYEFGQGVITYADQEIVSLLTTMMDTYRVADDLGKLQFQLKVAHAPLLGWKGSFVVAKAGAELDVTFDNGPESSIAEDAFFGLLAASKGYKFGFIEGTMQEKSPFTVLDFLRQRKRWLQGLLLVTHSSRIPLRYRVLFGCYVYAVALAPVTACNLFVQPFFPLPMNQFLAFSGCFLVGVSLYMGFYGTVRSFSVQRIGVKKLILLLLLLVILIPLKVTFEIMAIVWALCTPKNTFVIIDKNLPVMSKSTILPI